MRIVRSVLSRVAVAAFCVPATDTAAQEATSTPPSVPPTYESTVRSAWRGLHNKLLTMAKDTLFPVAQLEARPHPESRSVIDELRHVTIGLEMSTAGLRGQRFDYAARLRADREKPRTRESVVVEMEAAMRESFAALDSVVTPSMVGWLEHQAEHYGKMVTQYRVLGIVPPISRPRPAARPDA